MASMAAPVRTPPPAESTGLVDPLNLVDMLGDSDATISELSSDEGSPHFGFTPKRPTKLPRAWERKAATPFAPRTETQKIWKRVPLQDRSINNTVNIRKNGEETSNPRAVKRQRVDALVPTVEKDGDGNYINTKYEDAPDSARRKVPRDPNNVLQNTRNSLSPVQRNSTSDILAKSPLLAPIEIEAQSVEERVGDLQNEQISENSNKNFIGMDTPETQAEADTAAGVGQTLDPPETCTQAPLSTDKPPADPFIPAEVDETPMTAMDEFFTDSVIFEANEMESESEEEEEQQTLQVATMEDGAGVCPAELTVEDQEGIEQEIHEEIAEDLEQDTSHGSEILSEFLSEELNKVRNEVVREQAIVEDVLVNKADGQIASLVELSKDMSTQNETCSRVNTEMSLQPLFESEFETGITEAEGETGPAGSINIETALESVLEVAYESAVLQGSPTPSTFYIEEQLIADLPKIPDDSREASEDASEIVAAPPQQAQALSTATCEDTAYLHEFLTRARAQKAAKASSSPEKPSQVVSSPAKGTRLALASLSTNAMSPMKLEAVELKPEELVVEDESTEEQLASPCRRSARTRLPKPQKAITAVPSTIPVRRSNGTEFIFLQRSEAQQVALATRANTKRNKGEAMPPKVKLEALASKARSTSPTKSPRKRSGRKQVAWHTQLAQSREVPKEEANETTEETTQVTPSEAEKPIAIVEEKPRTRKVRRLGTVNGTPAPKKVMPAPTTSELPVPVRRLRTRTQA